MTPKQADRLIQSRKPVTLREVRFDQTFSAVLVSRDRYNVRTACGMVLDRGDLEIVENETANA